MDMQLRAWDLEFNKMVTTTLEDICKEIGFEYGIDNNVWQFTQAIKAGSKAMVQIGKKDMDGTDIYTHDILTDSRNEIVIKQVESGFIASCIKGECVGQDIKIEDLNMKECKIIGNTEIHK